MIIRQQELMKLPVVTESGDKLGTVHDIELDVDTHAVRLYLVSRFLGREIFSIAPAQVKSITAEKMVVDDAVTKVRGTTEKSLRPPQLDPLAP